MGHLNGILARVGGNLNNNFQKSQMPGGLPGGMLKLRFDRYINAHKSSSSAAVTPSVDRLINPSFSSGKFQSRWKTAKVTPLFENGLECDPCNLRAIYLSKIIERHFMTHCTTSLMRTI